MPRKSEFSKNQRCMPRCMLTQYLQREINSIVALYGFDLSRGPEQLYGTCKPTEEQRRITEHTIAYAKIRAFQWLINEMAIGLDFDK